ncbi:hypothetical protein ACGFYO_15885 [Streptomyces sp. NPDC048201]|uniref:hypothetical protein n=1 Tax=unclassified Streptomyces TaxID=2593676 RepID=UPI0013680C84|nr:hypothetical protein [Streptomyces sp. SID4982]MYS17280.1 hypothetical protein [Streptomyces sp. SID4982]
MADNPEWRECDLVEFPSEPSAIPGCSGCLGICVARANARSRGDYSAVSDANVRLRRHQAERHL